VITFPGFLRAYVESTDDEDAEKDDAERRLPRVGRGDGLDLERLDATGHTTSPPARYTDASLVKRLEELGIGRPSTYASIINTIQDRGYVWKKGSALIPTWLAFAVINLMEQHFDRLVDYEFTASLEDDLDVIAGGEGNSVEWLSRFYFGSADGKEGGLARQGGLKAIIGKNLDEIDARAISTIPIGMAEDGRPVVVRVGRYGPYVQVGTDGADDQQKASLPEDLAPDELTVDKAVELAAAPSGDRVLGTDPVTGYDVVARAGRYGPYVSLVLPEGSKDKPPTASLFASMDLETITLEQALKLLTLPRVLGEHEGEPVTAQNGRYGPYISRLKESRSLESEEALFEIDLDRALALLATPKQYGRKASAPKPPLKELGADPVTGAPMVVKEGRFGPYVTDGETNASLRKGDVIESLTDERAAELLAERRARGPAPKKTAAKKAPAKKAPAKKATAKKATARKAPAKKAAAEKA
jgi:DNA topoisomerase-1